MGAAAADHLHSDGLYRLIACEVSGSDGAVPTDTTLKRGRVGRSPCDAVRRTWRFRGMRRRSLARRPHPTRTCREIGMVQPTCGVEESKPAPNVTVEMRPPVVEVAPPRPSRIYLDTKAVLGFEPVAASRTWSKLRRIARSVEYRPMHDAKAHGKGAKLFVERPEFGGPHEHRGCEQ